MQNIPLSCLPGADSALGKAERATKVLSVWECACSVHLSSSPTLVTQKEAECFAYTVHFLYNFHGFCSSGFFLHMLEVLQQLVPASSSAMMGTCNWIYKQ